jgi:replication factor A1
MEEEKMLYEYEARRGRPSGRHLSQLDFQLLEYLAKVSLKYGVDSDRFFQCFLDAAQHQKSKCEELLIECRSKEKDYTIFLITKDREALGQFHMSEYLLNEKTNPLREFTGRLSSITPTQEAKLTRYNIEDLRAGMKHLNLTAEVIEVSQPIQIATRFGNYAYMANALIGDETGTIKLSLFGSQIKMVSVHDAVQIENGHVVWFRGERQLRISKQGKISVAQRPIIA